MIIKLHNFEDKIIYLDTSKNYYIEKYPWRKNRITGFLCIPDIYPIYDTYAVSLKESPEQVEQIIKEKQFNNNFENLLNE